MNEGPTNKIMHHYYGNTVRMMFMVAAIIMLVSLPIFKDQIGLPIFMSVVAILILGLAAGLTNPRLIWDAAVNLVVAVVGFFVFMTYTVNSYSENAVDRFFFTNLFLSLIFLLAVYFSVKTLRGLMLESRKES